MHTHTHTHTHTHMRCIHQDLQVFLICVCLICVPYMYRDRLTRVPYICVPYMYKGEPHKYALYVCLICTGIGLHVCLVSVRLTSLCLKCTGIILQVCLTCAPYALHVCLICTGIILQVCLICVPYMYRDRNSGRIHYSAPDSGSKWTFSVG